MNLTLHFNTPQATPTLKTEAVEVLTSALERFASHIRYVMVSVQDVNGPRGGVDKQCRCVLHLKRRPPIVIQDADESILNMLLRVAHRSAYTLSQEIERKQTSYRSRRRRDRKSDDEDASQPIDGLAQETTLG